MVLFLTYPKEKCLECGKKFYPEWCKVCRHRDFNTCVSCHRHTPHHKRESAKVGKIA